MTIPIAAFRPVGPRVPGPASVVVPVAAETVSGLAVVFEREFWGSPALTEDLSLWWDRLESVDVPGVAPLLARAPGVFVYGAPPLRLLRPLLGVPAGVRAGLELVVSAGELVAARPLGPHAGLTPDLLGLDAQGMAWLLGWRLPPVEVLQFLDNPSETPDVAAQYAPPERFEGVEEDEYSDLYALVAIAAMWMTGRPLFADAAAARSRAGEAEHAVRTLGLPEDVAELFSMALALDARERPEPLAFVEEIERLIEEADGPSASALPETPSPHDDNRAWWDALFSPPQDFSDDETAPREDQAAVVRRVERTGMLEEVERVAGEIGPIAVPDEGREAEEAVAEARGALRADPLDAGDVLPDVLGRLAVLRASIELRRVEEERIAADRARQDAENEQRLLAARATAEEVLSAALSEAADCSDDPAVAQLLGEVRAGVARTVELTGDGAATRAERALEATRRVRSRIGPVAAAARARGAEIRAHAARKAIEAVESNLARVGASARVADAAAERVERLAEQVGRPLDRLAPEVADVRGQARVAEALGHAAAAQEAFAAQVAAVRRVAIEVEFCSDPTDAESRVARIGVLAEEARATVAAIEAAVEHARHSAVEERDRKRRAKLAGIREVASARAAQVDPIAARVEAARIDLSAALEGEVFPNDIRGALATWERARSAVQAQRDTLAEVVELVEAEGPAARLSAAADAAVVAGSALVDVIQRTIRDHERDRESRHRATLEKQVKVARTEARRSVAAADGSAAAGDPVAAAADLERLAEYRRQVRQGQRDLDAAVEAGELPPIEGLAHFLHAAAANLVACAAEVDAATASARLARDPVRGERLRRLRRGASSEEAADDPARREALQASLRAERPGADAAVERVRAIRRLAGADAADTMQRRASRPPASEAGDPDRTAMFDAHEIDDGAE